MMPADSAAATMVLPVHRLTPYLRALISTDDRSLTIERRRSLVGLIPLWSHRIEIPLPELASARVTANVRLQCLTAGVLLAVTALVLHLALALRVVLVLLALLEFLLALAPGRAIRVERRDGGSWRVAFCRAHDFDARLALEDALRRRDATVGRTASTLRSGSPRTSSAPLRQRTVS